MNQDLHSKRWRDLRCPQVRTLARLHACTLRAPVCLSGVQGQHGVRRVEKYVAQALAGAHADEEAVRWPHPDEHIRQPLEHLADLHGPSPT